MSTTRRTTTLGDHGASYLRTLVPVIWGALVAQVLTWAGPRVPGELGDALDAWLNTDAAAAVATAAVIGVWYVLWRLVEPHVPAWLTRLALGSAAEPTYAHVEPDPPDCDVDDEGEHDYETIEIDNDGTVEVIPPTIPDDRT
ncbi:hypothetical protein FA014_01845 [Cellulomonas hominis]|uniref:Uncharacterized protein n=1 Tax=Cellulomonas hominis TaxID=156981 RepID=A0A7Z8K3E5_9CELL|nr:hypothetical protein [Cellulomonas hominis]TKR27124.1 hypothetical protein FA014_01845 [Cellulomonas hominis]